MHRTFNLIHVIKRKILIKTAFISDKCKNKRKKTVENKWVSMQIICFRKRIDGFNPQKADMYEYEVQIGNLVAVAAMVTAMAIAQNTQSHLGSHF